MGRHCPHVHRHRSCRRAHGVLGTNYLRRKVSGVVDRGVGSGEEQGLVVAARPPHHVGRASGRPPYFRHFTAAVGLSAPMSVDLDLITHSCLHVSLLCSVSIFAALQQPHRSHPGRHDGRFTPRSTRTIVSSATTARSRPPAADTGLKTDRTAKSHHSCSRGQCKSCAGATTPSSPSCGSVRRPRFNLLITSSPDRTAQQNLME
jgi:hypothetical protein